MLVFKSPVAFCRNLALHSIFYSLFLKNSFICRCNLDVYAMFNDCRLTIVFLFSFSVIINASNNPKNWTNKWSTFCSAETDDVCKNIKLSECPTCK